jgi:7-carboxy-7-deazaguanine synthase
MSIEAIVEAVLETGCPLVVVTGGEPLLQEGTSPLLERLLEEGLEVLLETGGHRSIRHVPQGVVCIIDVKCPGSGMADRNHWENLDRLTPTDEVKFVIADEEDYTWARDVVRDRSLADQVTVLFAPAWGEVDPADLAGWILRDQLPVRLQVQVHKVIWGPDRRGV